MRYSRTLITTFALIIMSIFLLTMDIQVQASEVGSEWDYTELADGTIELIKYSGDASEVVIPAQIDNKKVTSIGDTLFFCCSNLIRVEIPSGVTRIGHNTFAGCNSLTGITIPSSVTSINDFAFYNCSSNLFLYVVSGSYGETYAKEHFKNYIYQGNVACEHIFTSAITTAATCINTGVETFTCSKCGGYYTEPVPVSEHTVVKDPAVAATCTAGGKTEGSHCSVCNHVFVAQEATSELGHNYTTVIKKATPKKNGSVTAKCSMCGEINESQSYTIYKPKKILLDTAKSGVYTGKAIKPLYGVKDSKGNDIASKNYKVSYKNNKKVGIATVTVTFKGKYYSGKMTKKFTISPEKISNKRVDNVAMHSAKLSWIPVKQATGYQIQYSANKNFKKAKTVLVKKSQTTSTVINGLLNGKEQKYTYRSFFLKGLKENTKYYYRVRAYKTVKVNGKFKKIYAQWSQKDNFTTIKMPTLNTRPVASEWAGGYELYVLHLDERGYPYFYGYGIGGTDKLQTDICMDEASRYMFELEKALGTDFGTVHITWEVVGEHNGIPVVRRYAEPLYRNFFED